METLQLGSKGQAVTKLQIRLNYLGYTDSGGAMIAEDGSFGPKTEQAVNKFKDAVLPDGNKGENRGKVGATTWEYLDKAVPLKRIEFLPPKEYNGGKPWSTNDTQNFIEFEAGNKLQWAGCTPRLIAAKNNFESECRRMGWSVVFKSAYRPLIYQAHFYDIYAGPASKTSAGREHCRQHGIRSASYPRRTSSTHTMGVAFDAVVTGKDGKVLNPAGAAISKELAAIANNCGFKTPPANDTVHFELVTV